MASSCNEVGRKVGVLSGYPSSCSFSTAEDRQIHQGLWRSTSEPDSAGPRGKGSSQRVERLSLSPDEYFQLEEILPLILLSTLWYKLL